MVNNGPAKGNVTGNLDYFHYAPAQSVDMFATCQQCFPFLKPVPKHLGVSLAVYTFYGESENAEKEACPSHVQSSQQRQPQLKCGLPRTCMQQTCSIEKVQYIPWGGGRVDR